MLSAQPESHVRTSPRSTDDLVRSILTATNRQVQGLQVTMAENAVVVTGRSPTYYVKQLVTQAVRSRLPSVQLDNEILVCAN